MEQRDLRVGNRLEYIGDEVGTTLQRTTYRVVSFNVDNVNLRAESSDEYLSISKEEIDYHLEMGTLKIAD